MRACVRGAAARPPPGGSAWARLGATIALMFDPQMELLSTVLWSAVQEEASDSAWTDASEAAKHCGELEETLIDALVARDRDGLLALLEAWQGGKSHAPAHDRDVLKRALKAFRKRLKVTLLDDESKLGGGAFSGGRDSSIVAITPPHRYPIAVWDELVRLGRLVDSKHGMYELPPGG